MTLSPALAFVVLVLGMLLVSVLYGSILWALWWLYSDEGLRCTWSERSRGHRKNLDHDRAATAQSPSYPPERPVHT